MQIKKGKGTIKALEIPVALAGYNDDNGVIRARLIFSFVGAENIQDTEDLTAQLLSRTGNNTFSVIIDITDIPTVKEGDIAIIIGKSGNAEITAYDIAEQTGTITNEILSRLGSRLDRFII